MPRVFRPPKQATGAPPRRAGAAAAAGGPSTRTRLATKNAPGAVFDFKQADTVLVHALHKRRAKSAKKNAAPVGLCTPKRPPPATTPAAPKRGHPEGRPKLVAAKGRAAQGGATYVRAEKSALRRLFHGTVFG